MNGLPAVGNSPPNIKMPKPITRQNPQGRRAKAAAACNNRAVQKALSSEEGAFARVEKELGFSQFLVNYHDGKELHVDLLATPRGSFSAGGKVRVRICVGDIVLLDGIQMLPDAKKKGKKIILEITGKLEKKEAQTLFSNGRIDKAVYTTAEKDAEEDLFDYSGEDAKEEEDVDVDAI